MNTIDTGPVLALLRRILNELITHPENLIIDSVSLTRSATVTIQAHAADTPRLIGAGAGNYLAISKLLSVIGHRNGYRINVPPIRESVVGTPERYRFVASKTWPRERILALIADIAKAVFEYPESVNMVAQDDEATFSTTLEVHVSRSENKVLVKVMQEALGRLVDAVGKCNGRLVYMDLVSDKELSPLDPPQPTTAAGRFAPEKSKI